MLPGVDLLIGGYLIESLFIDILSMANLKCKDDKLFVIDLSNYPIIAVSVTPKPFLLSFKLFAKRSGVFGSVQLSIHPD